MRRIPVLVIVAAGLGLSLYFAFQTPTASFDLATLDGGGRLIYTCTASDGEDEARARAIAAHDFFQAQIAAVAEASAKGMQEAMDAAEAAGTTPDFAPIDAVREDLTSGTMSAVTDLFGCTVSEPAP